MTLHPPAAGPSLLDPCPCGEDPIGADSLGCPVCDECAPVFQGAAWSRSELGVPLFRRPGADFIDGAYLLTGSFGFDAVVLCEEDSWSCTILRTRVDPIDGRLFSDGQTMTAREAEALLLSADRPALLREVSFRDLYR